MRTLTLLRRMLLVQKDIMQEINQIRRQLKEQDKNILLIFEYLKQLEEAKQQQLEQANRKRIGFRSSEK